MTLLDVGCGPGTLSVDLARVVAPGRVLAVDVVDDALPEARAHAAAAGVDTIEFRVDDGYALDAASSMFDVVHAHQVLPHVSDPVRLLRELRRVARASSFARQAVDRGLATADELSHSPPPPGSGGVPATAAGWRSCTARSSAVADDPRPSRRSGLQHERDDHR